MSLDTIETRLDRIERMIAQLIAANTATATEMSHEEEIAFVRANNIDIRQHLRAKSAAIKAERKASRHGQQKNTV